MKKLIKYKILECVFLIITVILLIFLFNYVIKLKEHDNLLILLTDTGEESLYAEFAYWDIPYNISRFCKGKTDVSAFNKTEQNVSVYFVDEKFKSVSNINIISGNYDTSENNAVISYQTAISLYANRNCIGKTIIIYEKVYNIAGVYKVNDKIPFCFAQTDYSSVIIDESKCPDSERVTYWFVKSKPELIPLIYEKYKDDPSVIACNTFADVQGAIFIFYCFIFSFFAGVCLLLFMKFKDAIIIRTILFLIGCSSIIAGLYVLRRNPCQPPAFNAEAIINYNNRTSLPLFEYAASWQSLYIIITGCLLVIIFVILTLNIFLRYHNSAKTDSE